MSTVDTTVAPSSAGVVAYFGRCDPCLRFEGLRDFVDADVVKLDSL